MDVFRFLIALAIIVCVSYRTALGSPIVITEKSVVSEDDALNPNVQVLVLDKVDQRNANVLRNVLRNYDGAFRYGSKHVAGKRFKREFTLYPEEDIGARATKKTTKPTTEKIPTSPAPTTTI